MRLVVEDAEDHDQSFVVCSGGYQHILFDESLLATDDMPPHPAYEEYMTPEWEAWDAQHDLEVAPDIPGLQRPIPKGCKLQQLPGCPPVRVHRIPGDTDHWFHGLERRKPQVRVLGVAPMTT